MALLHAPVQAKQAVQQKVVPSWAVPAKRATAAASRAIPKTVIDH
jgi:hypothetical protein